jgi:hypothetical protein
VKLDAVDHGVVVNHAGVHRPPSKRLPIKLAGAA